MLGEAKKPKPPWQVAKEGWRSIRHGGMGMKPRRRSFPQKGDVLVRGTQHLKMFGMALLYRS